MIKRIFSDRSDEIFEIMEKSFPLTEYRTREEQAALFDREEYRVLASLEGDRMLGFIAFWELDGLTFLEHLATLPEARNRGLGAELLRSAVDMAENPVCFEVEPPEDELTRRRVGFYERNGMYLNDYPYIQPPISSGREPIPLRIMTSGAPIDEERFRSVRDLLYRDVYGIK